VADDGCGFDAARTPPGTGLTNMRDRIGSLGGRLCVEASAERGVRVHGTVPALPVEPREAGAVPAGDGERTQAPVSDR
jgi:signal transduction histidine kinase